MSAACIGQPVSWLRLERYRLGELEPAEHRRVAAHLAACPACRSCLQQIEGDRRVLPPLPLALPLPAPGREAVLPHSRTGAARPGRGVLWAAAAGAVAVAASLLLVLLRPSVLPLPGRPAAHPARLAYKGGELALVLLRERDGRVVAEPDRYLDGDRFRLLVTCPPPGELPWEVVVFQGAEAFFPLPAGARLRCANRVALPGAFRLTGRQPATVCLTVGDRLPDRELLAGQGPATLPRAGTVCTELQPGE